MAQWDELIGLAEQRGMTVRNGLRTMTIDGPDTVVAVWDPFSNVFVGAEIFNSDGLFLAGTTDFVVARNWVYDMKLGGE